MLAVVAARRRRAVWRLWRKGGQQVRRRTAWRRWRRGGGRVAVAAARRRRAWQRLRQGGGGRHVGSGGEEEEGVAAEALPVEYEIDKKYKPAFDYFASSEGSEEYFRILSDKYVTYDAGTGIVHQAPARAFWRWRR